MFIQGYSRREFARFEVLTAVKVTKLFFWVLTSCRRVVRHQRLKIHENVVMEAEYFPGTFVSACKFTQHYNPGH
jgi:hypothetical protein